MTGSLAKAALSRLGFPMECTIRRTNGLRLGVAGKVKRFPARLVLAIPGHVQAEFCRAILAAPMLRTLKTLIVWLLLAVLPLQAVAAGRLSCAPVSQESNQLAHHAAPAQHEAMMDAHAHHGSEHASSDDASADGDGDKKPHSTCSACSAFCLGACAPPSTQLSVPAFDGSDAVALAPAAFAVGFIQDGPQRPPRQQSL
ncbi:hypothetical protein [Massilia sp. IC2-476]|uniref:hypothetical protein n=1 Tax=Massilia sp. IC2-476 TaxID=2887199 RepID=UPI001D118D9A|nr:hypothetical protein [Massilia sp. IC2-476]MCC2974903.1 hypothetical protein [Massilia sp. IC2-476]